MDTATLFDTTILHEMTHSRVVGILQQDSSVPEKYRWLPCTRLKSPYNAGTYVAFGQAAKQASKQSTIKAPFSSRNGFCIPLKHISFFYPKIRELD